MEQHNIFLTISLIAILGSLGVAGLERFKGIEKPAQKITEESKPTMIAHALFACAGNNSINATFMSDKTVDLILSDGRSLHLSQVISGSGARYANKNESFIFWNKGNTAFTIENDIQAFTDCTVVSK